MIYNTFGIEAEAERYLEIGAEEELRQLLAQGTLDEGPWMVVGGGSNMVFTRRYEGTVLHLTNKGLRVTPTEQGSLLVEAAAGEVWDDVVRDTCAAGLWGMENLAAIPGTVGASPVQNVGAYGAEAKDVIRSVKAYDAHTGEARVFANEECRFGYRDSIFKGELRGRYVVWSVTFELSREPRPNLQYKALAEAAEAAGLVSPTPMQICDLVTDIRWRKLPRPEVMGSAGSFFKNPVVDAARYESLKAQHPDIVAYPAAAGWKLAAGWLIERAGWKGRNMGRCGVYEHQALVLVNRGGCTGAEVVALADAITADVRRLFGVELEKEAIIV